MDIIHPSAKLRRVPVQTTENIKVNVVEKITERAPKSALPKVDLATVAKMQAEMDAELQAELDMQSEIDALSAENTPSKADWQPEVDLTPPEDVQSASDFDFDKELEKAFEGVDLSEEAFNASETTPENNIADIEDAAAQMFVDESVPVLDEEPKKPETDEAPDANNFSLGATESPFLPGARVDKRPLGLDVKLNAESPNITKSTKNVYARREMLGHPKTPIAANRPTMVVDNPKKKDHGFLWALLIIFVTLLGAGAGALVYYLMYNK